MPVAGPVANGGFTIKVVASLAIGLRVAVCTPLQAGKVAQEQYTPCRMRKGYVQRLKCDRVEAGVAWLTDAEGNSAPLTDTSGEQPDIGQTVDAFVFTDAAGNPQVTLHMPLVERGGCAALKVVATGSGGVFLDWGLDKHLLLPFAEQRRPLEVGHVESVLVYLDNTGRLAATSRLDHHLDETPSGFAAWQPVDLLVYQRTDLGYKAVADNRAVGLIFSSDVFQTLEPGMRLPGWIKRVREDGRLDLALQPPARELKDPLAERVVEWLQANGGVGMLTDRSSPDDIKAEFQVSKKNFKRALSALYKQRRITLEPDRVVLVSEPQTPGGGPGSGSDSGSVGVSATGETPTDDTAVGEVDFTGRN